MSLHDRIDILVNDYCKEKTTQLYPKHYKTCHDKSKLLQLLFLTIIVSSSKHYTITIIGKYNIKVNRQNQLTAHPFYMLMWSLWCQSVVFNL